MVALPCSHASCSEGGKAGLTVWACHRAPLRLWLHDPSQESSSHLVHR